MAAIGCGEDTDHRLGRAGGGDVADASGVDADAGDAGENPDVRDGSEPDANTEPCDIDATAWTLEDQALSLRLACASGRALEPSELTLRDAPEGLELADASTELRWTPGLDQAGNYAIEVRLRGGERGEVRIGVADRFEHPNNVPVVDPLRYTHELGVPVFHLDTAPDINDANYTDASLIFAGRAYASPSAKYRGSTSAQYPKRSFTLKFGRDDLFDHAARGFSDVRKLVLTSTFDDNSQLRQRLAFELWNRLDAEHFQIRHFSAVVYLDGRYQGIYAVTDHVNDEYLLAAGLPAGVGVYKARQKEANLRTTDRDGNPKSSLRAGYTKEEGEPPAGVAGAYDDLVAFVEWVATAPDDAFRAEAPERLAPDFEAWFMLVSVTAAVDTTVKNYFLIHDARPGAEDPRWRFIPWDFNASFGQSYRTLRRGPEYRDVVRFSHSNRLFERMTMDPPQRAELLARFRDALDGVWSAGEVCEMLDEYAAEVAAAAERDALRWDEAARGYFTERTDFAPHRDEIEYLRDWIEARWALVATQISE